MQRLPEHCVEVTNDVAHPVKLLWLTTLPTINGELRIPESGFLSNKRGEP